MVSVLALLHVHCPMCFELTGIGSFFVTNASRFGGWSAIPGIPALVICMLFQAALTSGGIMAWKGRHLSWVN
jgi:hypothetical protein